VSVRVLRIIPAFYPAVYWGGAVVSVFSLCNVLASLEGMELEVLTTNAAGPKRRDRASGVNSFIRYPPGYDVYYCHGLFGTDISPDMLLALWGRVREADLVHLSGVYSPPTMPTLMACRLFRKALVWSPHGAWQRWGGSTRLKTKRVWDLACRAIAPKQCVLHVTSIEEARETSKRFPCAEVVIIPNGVDAPKEVAHVDERRFLRVVYLGRLHPKKGIENLMAACKKLTEQAEVDWSLIIAGSGDPRYVRQLENKMEEFGFGSQGRQAGRSEALSSSVTFIGEVTGGKKTTLFENADVVVAPSFTENFGMVVAEALAHGVPVIASTGTPWHRVEEIGCGLWVNNDPETLAKALDQINRMPMREMGQRGREWMQREFSWSDRAKDMSSLYHSLVSK